MEHLAFIVPAAGQGSRLQAGQNKMLVPLAGQPLLTRTLSALARGAAEANIEVTETIIVAAADEVSLIEKKLLPEVKPHQALGRLQVVPGGATRQQSVANGLAALSHAAQFVAVHDGARPNISGALLQRVVAAGKRHGAAVPTLMLTDTVKKVGESGRVVKTLPRATLRLVQTPQVFRRDWLERAHRRAADTGAQGTDDASLVEMLGEGVYTVPGTPENIKVTEPGDLERAWMARQATPPRSVRVGFGYDVHRVSADPQRPLILGGVRLPAATGLEGHSDADVLAHAITDALLGAAALGDIGQHFPDTDTRYAGADSMKLLQQVVVLINEAGLSLINVDATVAAEAPRLAPHIPAIRQRLAQTLTLPVAAVSVKATTSEGLGFVGTGAGVAAYAICSLATDA